MFRLYSKGCEYTIRALSRADFKNGAGRFIATTLCRQARVPEPFTRKIFQQLVQTGVLKAATGPGGGYALAQHPKRITILSLIRAIDGEKAFEGCVMGLPQCNRRRPCPMHASWKLSKQRLLSSLGRLTLHDIRQVAKERSVAHGDVRKRQLSL